ncbi:hypothetical protein MVEG_00750 [Podila verticillata NRRL 6337]|nr:hypothetical protein MVEG_00750 [Podila verticillata NRRL 6337]
MLIILKEHKSRGSWNKHSSYLRQLSLDNKVKTLITNDHDSFTKAITQSFRPSCWLYFMVQNCLNVVADTMFFIASEKYASECLQTWQGCSLLVRRCCYRVWR